MGNNSSSHHQHCPSNGLSHEMGRGWTQSFPRELSRHHSQPPGHKVLPEPSNQRLRATNNGSIIHNGGTISGRRSSALTLPHDLNKQGVFRSRSTSASNFGNPRFRRSDHHCCHYQTACESHCMESEMQELKRFGSEPDLRYSPNERNGRPHGMVDHGHHQNHYYPERDSRERESRYRGKKKYKAPPPPAINGCADGSSPDSYKWEAGQDHRDSRCRAEEDSQPAPPRRSRLFKTRAETKRAQVNWMSSSSSQSHQERDGLESDRRWRTDRAKENTKPSNWKDPNHHHHHHHHHHHQDQRWGRDEQHRRSKMLDGKNTLQRSMSSPEFQAELMQVARKVRNKLNCNGREPPLVVSSLDRKSEPTTTKKDQELENGRKTPESRIRNQEMSIIKQEERRPDGRVVTRVHEERRLIVERCRIENKRNFDERRSSSQRDISRSKDYLDERPVEVSSNVKRKPLQKTANVNDASSDRARDARKATKERLETLGQDKSRRDHPAESHSKLNDDSRNRKSAERANLGRTRSESPIRQSSRDRPDIRGQGSGRESTPEPNPEHKIRDKDNADSRWRKPESRNADSKSGEKRWPESAVTQENHDLKSKEKDRAVKKDAKEVQESNWHILPPNEKSVPKTFYFGMDEELSKESRNLIDRQMEQLQSRLQSREINNRSPECNSADVEDMKNAEDISLKLRPTLPKKQLEIPRFSPSAAWRLLSALEAPGPTMSTASEEIPVMFEERIERMSRPPPPLVALGPRSSHDKSGDSGISGDAGAANDDSLDVSTTNRMKTPATRPTWTPQQDLGEESSSDAGVDSPPPMVSAAKFPPRAHVFSLSLPRDDNRMYLYSPNLKGKEGSTFNSLQKLKRSVSGALGLGPLDPERKRSTDMLDDNWLLSTSAPTSLQHNQIPDAAQTSAAPVWKGNFDDDDDDLEEDMEDRNDFPVIMKPPSFSYLASGGHVMYLPDSNGTDYQPHSLNCRTTPAAENEKNCNSVPKYRKNGAEEIRKGRGGDGKSSRQAKPELGAGVFSRERSFVNESSFKAHQLSSFSKSCENISEMKQRTSSPTLGQQNLQDNKETSSEIKAPQKSSSKGRRFTFQSTVRQIERRRLAEKLSREAEAKERQRKGELEAMRKVEEEFQRKRAREKANIRQQLRLYSMDENMSLPTVWDSSQLSRADPDGAPSSSASSPTSAPPGKLAAGRKGSVSSDEYHRKRGPSSDSKQQQHQQQPREYKDYRSKYYDWPAETSSQHVEYKQTTVHPKVVCDIPKSSPVFVDANNPHNKLTNSSSTPRSDNYRKDFAHGAVAARSSLASSDSELSQPNTRPHSRQTGNKSKPLRSRSASPERSEGPASSEDEIPVEPIKQERNLKSGFVLNTVQPFVREKSYRPISFNPQPPPPIPS